MIKAAGSVGPPPGAGMRCVRIDEQVRTVFDRFRELRRAGGYHHAALAGEDVIHDLVLDVFRHNAVDKVVGRALRQGSDVTHAAIVLSGRITADIAVKAARPGVPVVA